MATINGTSGNDLRYGTNWFDLINVFAGNDTVYAQGGNDTVYGGSGNDWLYGQDGNDLLDDTGGARGWSYGGNGNDTIRANVAESSDRSAPDPIIVGRPSYFADGGSGDDRITTTVAAGGEGGAATNTLHGGAGNDTITGTATVAGWVGVSATNEATGGTGNDLLTLTARADTTGGGAHNTVSGGDGNDRITLTAQAGMNYGDDIDAGNTADGGSGNDNIAAYAQAGASQWTEWGGFYAQNSLVGGLGDDTILGSITGATAANPAHLTTKNLLYGGAGNDWVQAVGGKTNTLDGGDGNDTLIGDTGSDTLTGGAGNDRLVARLGKDVETGGSGADKFVFYKGDTTASLSTADVITDFRRADGDKIDVIGTNVSYFGGYDSTPEANEVSYYQSGANTIVTFNDGGVHSIVLQNLALTMTASDFLI